jgi:D-mannonate dehydratase
MSETFAAEDAYKGAPVFVHACRVLDCLFMATNGMSHCPGRDAAKMLKELEEIRRRFAEKVLFRCFERETPEAEK